MFYSLMVKDVHTFFKVYQYILLTVPSYYDFKEENSYQAFRSAVRTMMLGMSVYLKSEYDIIRNRESGKGRCDIILRKKKENLPNIVMEFKFINYGNEISILKEKLKNLANIKEKQYAIDLHGETIFIGLSHCGKQAYMEYEEVNL